jgi:glycosyltransferase involved in cell wall biosynthesis
LQKQGFELCFIENVLEEAVKGRIFARIFHGIYRRIMSLFNKKYLGSYSIDVSKYCAKIIKKKLPMDADCVFAPAGCMLTAYLKTDKIKIGYNDGTFAVMRDYYPDYCNVCKKTLKEADIVERKSIANCDLLLYSSEWAANSAVNDYNALPSKVKVVPFGANFETARNKAEITLIIQKRSLVECRLLFVGKEWKRKGGEIALNTAIILHNRNINVHLDIVGISDTINDLPSYVTNHGFVSKKTDSGRNLFDKLFSYSHFFILPTRQECFGIVFSEAASYALPILTTRTGGVESVVKDNITGKLFSTTDTPVIYADAIQKIISSRDNYLRLCFSTYNDFNKRLNWNIAGYHIEQYINNILTNAP